MKFRSLQFKIITAIIGVLLVSISTSIVMTTENQRRNLLSTAEQTLSVNTELLNQVIRNIMLSGEAEVATKTLSDIRKLESFEEVEIYRGDGSSAFSDYGTVDFVNSFQDIKTFDYTERSEIQMADNDAFREVLTTNTPLVRELKDSRELEYFFPILNYSECRACHGEESFIRGISHFKISIGNIYEQVSFAAIVLTAFFVAIGLIIFFMLFFLIRRLIIDKVLAIGRTVSVAATGDLDVQIEMESNDELGSLSDRINQMIRSLKEKRQLEIEHALTESTLKENRKYLSNIREGLIMIDKDFFINENYSLYMKEIFPEKQISGENLIDFLFEDDNRNKEIREELRMFISMVFNNTTADLDMISDINPLLDCPIDLKNRRIYIDAFVQRIMDSQNNVENVMIIFKDKTGLIQAEEELEKERQKAQSELDYITALLKTGPDTFLNFLSEGRETLDEVRKNQGKLSDRNIRKKCFRDIHSLKGSAGYFNFRAVENISHEIENRLKEEIVEDLTPLMDILISEFENIEDLINRFRDFADKSKTPLEQFFTSLESMVVRMAEDLNKKINIECSSEFNQLDQLDRIKKALIHLVRNAADHGIEDPMERIASGKQETGKIELSIGKGKKGGVEVCVGDDGQGIDFSKLEKMARSKGILKDSEAGDHKKLLSLLFHSGFSTKSEVSSISGRGVGLDAVREDIKALGGTISVRPGTGLGAKFTIHLPIEEEIL